MITSATEVTNIASNPPATPPTKVGDTYTTEIYSITAGRVYGNTEVTMSGGWVMRNIYGGGNMGSVGKGNYAGGADDYTEGSSISKGYGEHISGNLWTPSSNFNPNAPITTLNKPTTMADYFLSSGKSKVVITGGKVGYLVSEADKDKKKVSSKDDMPTGNVFGGCRGESAPNITETPRYHYCPAFFSGYVNETDVTIGDATNTTEGYTGPIIYGSVYGGGQDGHVRRDTKVTVNKGTIGIPYNTTNTGIFGDLKDEKGKDNLHWLHRGNVYGSGSGIGKYEYDFNYDGDYNDVVSYGPDGRKVETKEKDYSTSAGSVTRFTEVNINGGTIHRNVYGGGSLASVGPPAIPSTRPDVALIKHEPTAAELADKKGLGWQSMCTVNIAGATIGTPDDYNGANTTGAYNEVYGGEVYGGSRGMIEYDDENKNKFADFATTVWTQVNIKNGTNGTTIMGNVFGGGDAGAVKKDTDVRIGDE